jgi:anti-sigma regulatory factor (Ser/Thr protein kinase)/ABC-type transporter Mla MlaB component
MSSGHADSGDLAGALAAHEAAPAITLSWVGEDLVLASANEAARHAFGDRCTLGRPVREIAPEVDERTIEQMDDMVDTVLATGRSISRPAHRVQVHAEERGPFEVYWDLTLVPCFADDGSVSGVLAHGMDVTRTTQSAQSRVEHDRTLVTLQDVLLPEFLPVLPGVEIAGRYLLAEDDLVAGGDWYDAVGLLDGRVALVVGDVAGHGVAAAAAMGRLRSVAQERLRSGADLPEVMRALDSFARMVPEASAATICVLLLDPTSGRLEYCTAGHPPPLVLCPDEAAYRYLPHSQAAPLATTGEMTVARDRVGPGDLVLLYTDGVLARPGRAPSASTVELGQVASDAAADTDNPSGPADRVCRETLKAMTRRSGYADDIALLVAELTPLPKPLHLELLADSYALPRVLDALATWLEAMHVRELDHIVVQHAVDELVTNVVDHAYATSDHPGGLTVDAELLSSGEAEICFADSGAWVPPHGDRGRGHGLGMVRGMVDRLLVRGSEHGTVVVVQHRLSRPAWMLTGSTRGRRLRDPLESFTLAADATGLHLAGSLDRTGLDDLLGALDDVPEQGRVVVDLEGVTRLPSSAVQALHTASRKAADRGQDLVLYAPAGTTAQQVLELVRLPYVLTLTA